MLDRLWLAWDECAGRRPFELWEVITPYPPDDRRCWRRRYTARASCSCCNRRFWRVYRYACRKCVLVS